MDGKMCVKFANQAGGIKVSKSGGVFSKNENKNMETSNFLKNWDSKGKNELTKQMKNLLKDENSIMLIKKSKGKDICRVIYDLIHGCLKGEIKKDALLTVLAEFTYMHKDVASITMDIFQLLDTETSVLGDPKERSLFGAIVKDSEKIFSEKLLKERLETDTLQEFGIVAKNFYGKFIKIKTKLYYKQRRFNLFREENEGYAKLMTELNKQADSDGNSLEIVRSLIGCFNVDPNRVLDVILESFEVRLEREEFYIPLLKSYMPDSKLISEVLGYKFRSQSEEQTSFSLYQVTAILLQHDIILLNDIYSWLTPNDEQIFVDWQNEIAEAKEYVRKLKIISTNKDKDEKEQVEVHPRSDKYMTNQKMGLCQALLKIGDWKNALEVIERLPDKFATSYEPIAKELCELIHKTIEPIYRVQCAIPANIKGQSILPHPNKKAPPQCANFMSLRNHVFSMFHTLGPSLHYDPVLLQKLIRIMISILEKDLNVDASTPPPITTEGKNVLYYDVISLLDSCVLPSLSYLTSNCPVAEEIWSVIKLYPYHIRYSLYSRWKNESFMSHPKLIRMRGDAEQNIKALMKRVSKENVKPVGRRIGKLTHSSPGFLFDYVVGQIQLYDNLIVPVVDALRFLTSLSYDVLGYCVIEALVTTGRDRFKYGGTSLSDWLQSLAYFCGAIYKKYSIELSGLLQYICNQLKAHKSLDLLILKEIVQKMVGIEAVEEMTNEQLSAMCGGELLKGEAGYFSQVRNTKKSSLRLKEALASNDLAVTLCLLTAQQKHCVIYRETSDSHPKLVGKLYDQCQDTLVQFGNFLGSTYSVEEYVDRLPSIHSMLQEYHIHSDVAFFLARPMFTHAINQKYELLRKNDTSLKKMSSAQKQEKYIEASNFVMNPVIESVRPLHPNKVWEDISPQFLVTFWSLSMYDLQTPSESYQREINKLKQQISALTSAENGNTSSSKTKKELDRIQIFIDKLQEEKKKQQEHVEKIMARLNEEKDSWFPARTTKGATKNETIPQFLQLCLFPRCTFTALDALYCAKFVNLIHNLKTPNFSTLLCFDRIFCDITCSITTCTENEANRYGRFLNAMLETVMKWHSDQATFNKECANYPGFVTKFRVSNQCTDKNDSVGYENFRHVCHKWHFKITRAVVTCLSSKDYIQIRNAFIILMHIQNHFPVVMKTENVIHKRAEKVRDEEKNKREDLHVLASSYLGILKQKQGQLIAEQDFHQTTAISGATKSINGSAKTVEKAPVKEPSRSESRSKNDRIKTVERDVKSTSSYREISKDPKRQSNSRERSSVKEESKQESVKEKRREKRSASVEFEGNLSSVSNSSSNGPNNNDVVIVDEQRESKRRKIEISTKKKDEDLEARKKDRSVVKKEKREKTTDEEKELKKEKKLIKKKEREEIQIVGKRKKEEEKPPKIPHNGDDEKDSRYSRNKDIIKTTRSSRH